MSSKKFLSNKKTSHQTISLSPALKDWINRYVNVNKRSNPKDERFRSTSSFYNYIMENIMYLFKEGKTLDDFKRVEDKTVKEFFEEFTFQATIPLYEMVSQSNRFSGTDKNFNRFLLYYLNFLKRNVRKNNYDDLRLFFERIRNRVDPSTTSKSIRFDIFKEKDQALATGILEFVGKQRNLHFENCKFFAAIFGILGARVTDFIYSPDDYYGRIELLETDLLFREDLARKERLELLEENVNFLINYSRLLDDKEDKFLWMKLAIDNSLNINFKNKHAFNRWIKIIEKDLQKYTNKEDFLRKLLFFFEKLHWIKMINERDLSFQIDQAIVENKEQKQYLINYLSKSSKISEIEGSYYLK